MPKYDQTVIITHTTSGEERTTNNVLVDLFRVRAVHIVRQRMNEVIHLVFVE